MKIAVVGLGYVGMSNAVLLAQHHDVVAVDIDPRRVELVNARQSTVADADIERYLRERNISLRATLDGAEAYADASYVVIATPTDFDAVSGRFDTRSIESVARAVAGANPQSTMVIRSTVPIGYTARLRSLVGSENILFAPEFLREGKALHDNLHPSRIIVGEKSTRGQAFADVLAAGAEATDVPVLLLSSTEAEAIKLFSNAYLAMRVAFFNELDTFAMEYKLDAADVIRGVGLDPRIGSHYSNPSFGYGGYCLPKDTKQLLTHYGGIPQRLISAIVESNDVRMDYLADHIAASHPATIGVCRLTMKEGSDNVRSSSTRGLADRLVAKGIDTLVYEPSLSPDRLPGFRAAESVEQLFAQSDVVVTNRRAHSVVFKAGTKVFSRDAFGGDQ